MTQQNDFEQWAKVWHQTCETMMTMLGLSGAGSPQEMLVELQDHLGQPQTSQKPIGYGYSDEIQNGHGSYFIVVREKHDVYDTPIYADTRPDRNTGEA